MLQGRMWNVTGWGPRLCAVGERTAVEVMKHREGERERFPGRQLNPLPRPRLFPSLPGLWPPGEPSREQAHRHTGAQPGLQSSADLRTREVSPGPAARPACTGAALAVGCRAGTAEGPGLRSGSATSHDKGGVTQSASQNEPIFQRRCSRFARGESHVSQKYPVCTLGSPARGSRCTPQQGSTGALGRAATRVWANEGAERGDRRVVTDPQPPAQEGKRPRLRGQPHTAAQSREAMRCVWHESP